MMTDSAIHSFLNETISRNILVVLENEVMVFQDHWGPHQEKAMGYAPSPPPKKKKITDGVHQKYALNCKVKKIELKNRVFMYLNLYMLCI